MEIYDDKSFFNNYFNLRQDPNNYNDNFEHPYIMGLVGDCTGLRVLDIGCGYGETCAELMRRGAESVVGIDISSRMIECAKEKNAAVGVTYAVMDATDIGGLDKKFDLIVSSLALHYVEDLGKVFRAAHEVLKPNGRMVFSVEHPIYTATLGNIDLWLEREDGTKIAYALDNYANEGVRHIVWLGKEITKYHRTVATFIRLLSESGFALESLHEPAPTGELIERISGMAQEIHRPAYLFISAKRV